MHTYASLIFGFWGSAGSIVRLQEGDGEKRAGDEVWACGWLWSPRPVALLWANHPASSTTGKLVNWSRQDSPGSTGSSGMCAASGCNAQKVDGQWSMASVDLPKSCLWPLVRNAHDPEGVASGFLAADGSSALHRLP